MELGQLDIPCRRMSGLLPSYRTQTSIQNGSETNQQHTGQRRKKQKEKLEYTKRNRIRIVRKKMRTRTMNRRYEKDGKKMYL
jgi:hypothetical protein